MVNIEKHKAFLDSLEGGQGLPDEMHAWRFDEPLQPFDITMFMLRDGEGVSKSAVAYLVERIRRAESRQIPNLKEKVKAFGIACMNAEKDSYETDGSVDFDAAGKRVEELRALFAPEVKP